MIWLSVAAGGALGAALRHGVNAVVQQRWGGAFPIGIVVVNVTGCLAIGLLAGLLTSGRISLSESARTFLIAGVLGGFTTFSTYGIDTFVLARAGQPLLALINGVGQVAAGLLAVWAGFAAGSWRP